MSPANKHSKDHMVITTIVNLFAMAKKIKVDGRNECIYRKTGLQAAQPDASYYFGENANVVPRKTSIIDLDIYPPPNLVIEIANTSLADDKGEKRLLYEAMNVSEYWIVDVQKVEVIAFAIANEGSKKINESQVLPGLAISLLEEALQRTHQENQPSLHLVIQSVSIAGNRE
ncbi:MAG: Uma2 family endonuclease [Okeania sp. SIO2C2]|uniref:Uma2 family endonuclease n=1 Tax=Okeania sp. SIO2C2 TaxID=2607787 RepID=UPI0013B60274|nr:Uma2 family endonuclease [Okeania sp. SIO2C2]NEP89673.1 Uma2 family endonuclease [Okeania sp. SIO2C2]